MSNQELGVQFAREAMAGPAEFVYASMLGRFFGVPEAYNNADDIVEILRAAMEEWRAQR